MDMPKTVKVGAHTYAVLRKTKAQMNTDLGGCDTNTLQISVQQRLKKSKAKEILVHELLHACTHPSFMGIDDKFTDEDFVTAVAPVLLQVIQDNPDLLGYLTQ
jgi:hypothetical protein